MDGRERVTDDAAQSQPADLASSSRPEHLVLALQAAAGNRAVVAALTARRMIARWDDDGRLPPESAGFRSTAVSRPAPAWAETARHGRRADPEQPRGTLPFTNSGWDGAEIARRMSQLNVAAARTDEFSCVEASFIAELVQRGPDAVRRTIANYRSQYQTEITSRTPSRRLARLNRAVSTLTDLDSRLSNRTMSYEDLSRLQANLFHVHGQVAIQGTNDAQETAMSARAGFRRTALNLRNQTRAQVAAVAARLTDGEYLSCGIDASRRGTGRSAHAIHIRRGDGGSLFMYDPWPRRGAQQIPVGADLAEMSEYFEGQVNGRTVRRTFEVVARFTPSP